MSFVKARSENFKLQNVRLTFANIFRPQKVEENGVVKFQFNATLLYPKSTPALTGILQVGTETNIQDLTASVCKEAWGDAAIELIKTGVIKSPFLDGDGPQGVSKKTGKRHAGFEGHKFIRTARPKFKPGEDANPPELYGATLGADGKLVKLTSPKDMYSGCYVHAVLNIMAWEHPQSGKGLSFGLQMLQFAKDGERLGGEGGPDAGSFFQGAAPDKAPDKAPATTKTGDGAGGLFA